MDLGDAAGDSPWGDVPSQSVPPNPSDKSQPASSASEPQDPESSQQSQSSVKAPIRKARGPVRRLVAQPTQLASVDDPLGPLGPLGGGAVPAAEPSSDEPPAPPQKEQLPIRTTMPQTTQKKAAPSDLHGLEGDEDSLFDRAGRAPPPVQVASPSPMRTSTQPSVSVEQAAKPTFNITVGDPHKVGDLTSSHIVYSVRTRTTSKGYKQSEFEVKRRYRDFLWLYTTMHGNNPGVVVPPPPEKQALNRFESNFVESRRAALEKMCNKIAAHPTLQNDPDLKLFLESESFNVDVKHKERREPLPTESKGVLGSLGISMGSSNKFVEQDDWFHDRRVYLDALENQLKGLMKSMDSMVMQRRAMSEAAGDFSSSLHALSTVELSPTLSGPLEALSDLQLTIRDIYDRQAQQDVLTFGITIDEYVRLIGSVKQAFQQRQKAFYSWHNAEAELQKRKTTQDKLLRQGKSQQDRLNQVSAEVTDAERKVHQARLLFDDMGRLMRVELDRFEREKVEDFKGSVETFLESAVEAQKELIEKWETFLMQLDAEDDDTVFYRGLSHAGVDKAGNGRGNTAVDRARATIDEDSD
ncbi:sorting nexin-1/2 [Microdochium nivale]|nr:sorting nexin-1/2 [Microdochium nivale]